MVNKSEAIRAFIAANPGSISATIAVALGLDAHLTANACHKMAERGLLIPAPLPLGGPSRAPKVSYTIGREALMVGRHSSTPEERKANRAAKKRASAKNCRARRPKAQQPSVGQMRVRQSMTDCVRTTTQVAYGATPDTEAWLAAGGHKEVLPANWQQPTRYPTYAGGFV